MANEEHLAILKQGVEVWNKWRKEFPTIQPYFYNADLHEADLRNADFSHADLREADLRGADLRMTSLRKANLSGANLRGANLSRTTLHGTDFRRADLFDASLYGADLRGADLREANLQSADLQWSDLRWATLSGTYFCGADFGDTSILNLDLGEAIGLDEIFHHGPSSIGIDTIYKSKGKIPEVFLRGAGVPENFIAYMHSLTGQALQFYSCFISYSTKDQEFAERLHADLQAKGVRCWFASHDIQGGKNLREQIDQAIRIYDKLLLILSKNSMNSEWVKTEITNARQREVKEKRQMLFPVSLVPFESIRKWKAFDADTGKDSAREIREYFIPDFSKWKDHDSYQKAFDRLLRDLKAEVKEISG
jgi:hypothetical protein